jgi:hypothetical protein
MLFLKRASKRFSYPKGWKKDISKPKTYTKPEIPKQIIRYFIRSDLNSSKIQETMDLLNGNLKDELNEVLRQKFGDSCQVMNWGKDGFGIECKSKRKECKDFIQFIADKFIKKGSSDLQKLLTNTEEISKKRKYNGTPRFSPLDENPMEEKISSIASRIAQNPKLSPGVAFHLDEDGTWKAKPVPPEVRREAEYSGTLTIYGYKSVVFETPNGQSWAQRLDLSSESEEKEPEEEPEEQESEPEPDEPEESEPEESEPEESEPEESEPEESEPEESEPEPESEDGLEPEEESESEEATQLSFTLKKLSSEVFASKNPNPELISRDLRKIISILLTKKR